MRVGRLAVLTLLLLSPAMAQAAKLDANAVNAAGFSQKAAPGIDPMLVKAAILLDRAHFSPGEIDGRAGDNLKKALAAFQKSQNLPATGVLDQASWDELAATSSDPAITSYKLARGDVKGPFTRRIPPKMARMSHLKHLGYRNAVELLGEKFHMSPALLRALNRGEAFKTAGRDIEVANVPQPPGRDDTNAPKVVRIEVDKDQRALRAYDKDGKLLVFDPASIGSEEKPAPSGTFTVERVVRNPNYTYDPKYAFKGVDAKTSFSIAPGPNNPVGDVWIALSDEGYGIHGTPEPDKVSKALFARVHPADQLGRADACRHDAKGRAGRFRRPGRAGRRGEALSRPGLARRRARG